MDAFTLANEAPVIPLHRCALEQTRIPGQWDGNGAPVREVDTERVGRDHDLLRTDVLDINRESTQRSRSTVVPAWDAVPKVGRCRPIIAKQDARKRNS